MVSPHDAIGRFGLISGFCHKKLVPFKAGERELLQFSIVKGYIVVTGRGGKHPDAKGARAHHRHVAIR